MYTMNDMSSQKDGEFLYVVNKYDGSINLVSNSNESNNLNLDNSDVYHFVKFKYFAIKSFLWAYLAYNIGNQFAVQELWIVVIGVWIFSIPFLFAWLYSASIRQIQRLKIFNKRSLLYRLFSGRMLRLIFLFFFTILTSFYSLLQFRNYSNAEWIIFFLDIPVFLFVFALFRKLLSRELKTYIVTSFALTWARWTAALLMLLIHVGLFFFLCHSSGLFFRLCCD